MGLTDYDDPIASLDERDTSEDKRPHDALTQLRFGDQKRTELLRGNVNCRYLPDCIAVYDASSSRQLPNFRNEVPRTILANDGTTPECVTASHADHPLQHHAHPKSWRADFKDPFRCPGANRAVLTHSCYFSLGQPRVLLFMTVGSWR